MKREKLLKRLAAEIDLLRAVDVRIELGTEMAWKLLQAEMQPVERPIRVLEILHLLSVCRRQLLESYHLSKCLRDIDCARHELPCPQRPAIGQLDAGRPVGLHDDALHVRAGDQAAARLDEFFRQAAREADAAADADL